MNYIKLIWLILTNKLQMRLKTPRELVKVSYATADKMLSEKDSPWRLAPEEDKNMLFDVVYLERDLPAAPGTAPSA